MGKSRGRMKWVPQDIIEEISNIKIEEQIESDAEAFRKLAKFSKKGREIRLSRRFF